MLHNLISLLCNEKFRYNSTTRHYCQFVCVFFLSHFTPPSYMKSFLVISYWQIKNSGIMRRWFLFLYLLYYIMLLHYSIIIISYYYIIIIILLSLAYHVILLSYYYIKCCVTLWEFFLSAFADGLSLGFEWQQVCSSFQDSTQYSGRSKKMQ